LENHAPAVSLWQVAFANSPHLADIFGKPGTGGKSMAFGRVACGSEGSMINDQQTSIISHRDTLRVAQVKNLFVVKASLACCPSLY
jgi:hypothetical protein